MTAASQTSGSPGEMDTLAALAVNQHRAGRLAEAAATYRRILAARPDAADIHNQLGSVLVDQGQLDEAAPQFERAIALQADLMLAYYNLGNVRLKQNKLNQAATLLQQAIALAPDFADAHNNLCCVLRAQGKLDEAVAAGRQALALKPGFSQAHNNLGNVLLQQELLDQAVQHYRLALALAPGYAEAHNNLGNALMQQGQLEEARACYDRALILRPDYVEAHYHRSDLKTFRPGDAELVELEALAADPQRLPPDKMLFIHFALGKALEDTGDYARAFQHLLQANTLKRRAVQYDEIGYQRSFRAIVEAFDGDVFDRFAAVGDPSTVPIFIVGMPRSGSTLVEQILAGHPQVFPAGELKNLDRVVTTVAARNQGWPIPFPASVEQLGAAGLRQLGEAYLASLPALPADKTRLTDKALSNFYYVGLIRLILPHARIIHTLRDPVDTCVSCFSRYFAQGQLFSYELAELGCYYRWYYQLMDHWRSVLPEGAMLEVAYEEVVDNLEEQARRLIDFCGLPWDDRCLAFHRANRPVRTSSSVQVRQPIYRSSLARWRRYEPYLEPLLIELASIRETE